MPRVAIRPPASEMMIELVVSRATTLPWVALPGAVVFQEAGERSPIADVVPDVGDFEHADVGSSLHDGLVDGHALERWKKPRQGLGLGGCAECGEDRLKGSR